MQDLREFLDPKVLSKVDNLELVAKFIVQGFVIGLHRSPYHGFSVEFSAYRKYAQGDELKFVDWRVFGRTDKFYVKQFEETTNLNCYLAIDLSESMRMSDNGVSKFRYGCFIVAGLAYMMLKQGDCVGLSAIRDGQLDYMPAARRSGHLTQILAHLSSLAPQGRTDLGDGLAQLAGRIRSRSLVILVSDLLADPDQIADSLKYFRYKNHEVIVFHVLTQAELTFPFVQHTSFRDMETGQRIVTEPGYIRQEYLSLLQAHIQRLKRTCEEQQIDFLSLSTSDELSQVLMSYLSKRAMFY
jgi:uncharacterized protein (DUF58 family)